MIINYNATFLNTLVPIETLIRNLYIQDIKRINMLITIK